MSTSINEASTARFERTGTPASRLGNVFGWAFAAYRRHRMERELYELDDRMLRDIGLTRTEIPHLVRYGRGDHIA
ncbi:MAG: DUF1127 domain-containing protein [Hyphomicrobiaceae bacterium]